MNIYMYMNIYIYVYVYAHIYVYKYCNIHRNTPQHTHTALLRHTVHNHIQVRPFKLDKTTPFAKSHLDHDLLHYRTYSKEELLCL